MIVYVRTEGDRSVGENGLEVKIEGLPETTDREFDRRDLKQFFEMYLDEKVTIVFDDECEDCGQLGGKHLKLCPNAPGSEL